MKYTEFVKANYSKVANLPAKQRMAKLGQMWKASGHASGKGVVGGSEGGMFIKRKGGRKSKKQVRGKGFLSDMAENLIEGLAGGSVNKKKMVPAVSHNIAPIEGKGIISDTLGAFGLGMKKRHRKGKGVVGGDVGNDVAGGDVAGGDVAGNDVAGSGLFSGILGSFGLGMEPKKRGRPSKGKGMGKAVAGGDVAGSGIFSGVLGALGLGMPNKTKLKHFNRMKALEKQLHEKGKLTPVQHNKLKVYHTLHGAGFFDSLWSGIKKGASAVTSAITAVPQVLKVIPEAVKFVPAIGKLAGPLAKVAPLASLL